MNVWKHRVFVPIKSTPGKAVGNVHKENAVCLFFSIYFLLLFRFLLQVRALFHLLEAPLTCRQIVTRNSLENAISVIFALGGSTNAILHLLAVAAEADVALSMSDFNDIASKVPLLSRLKPHGNFSYTKDLFEAGGLPILLQELLSKGILHGDCMTVTGEETGKIF